jgi:hypothetical protein
VAVAVGLGVAVAVVIIRFHPPPMLPAEFELSSTTYKDHVPLADCPLNVARFAP